jgi:hypothetical protein
MPLARVLLRREKNMVNTIMGREVIHLRPARTTVNHSHVSYRSCQLPQSRVVELVMVQVALSEQLTI